MKLIRDETWPKPLIQLLNVASKMVLAAQQETLVEADSGYWQAHDSAALDLFRQPWLGQGKSPLFQIAGPSWK